MAGSLPEGPLRCWNAPGAPSYGRLDTRLGVTRSALISVAAFRAEQRPLASGPGGRGSGQGATSRSRAATDVVSGHQIVGLGGVVARSGPAIASAGKRSHAPVTADDRMPSKPIVRWYPARARFGHALCRQRIIHLGQVGQGRQRRARHRPEHAWGHEAPFDARGTPRTANPPPTISNPALGANLTQMDMPLSPKGVCT